MFNKQLNNEINNIDKPKHEYEDELNDKLHNKKRMLSKINDQFEEIQRLLGEIKFFLIPSYVKQCF